VSATEVQETIVVKKGDWIIFHNAGKDSGWTKASASDKTSREWPLLAISLEPFEYDKDGFCPETNGTDNAGVKHIPVAQYFARPTPSAYPGGEPIPSGHRVLLSHEEIKNYMAAWDSGKVARSISNGKGIRTVQDESGKLRHLFSQSFAVSDW
jgi:hypothetical protein